MDILENDEFNEPMDVEEDTLLQDPQKSSVSVIEQAIGVDAISSLRDREFRAPCKCKSKECHRVTSKDVIDLRKQIYRVGDSTSIRKEKLMKLLWHLSMPVGSDMTGRRRLLYKVDTKTVCQKTFLAATNLNKGGMFRTCRKLVERCVEMIVKVPRKAHRGEAAEFMIAWLILYQEEFGESPPNSDKLFVSERHKTHVYLEYKKSHLERALSYNSFVRLWKDRLPQICCITESPGFKRCTTCVKLTAALELRTLTEEDRSYFRMMKDRHFAQQAGERSFFTVNIEKAYKRPGQITLIIDGFDQKKTRLPIWAGKGRRNESAEMQAFPKLKFTVIGVRAWFYTWKPEERLFFFVIDEAVSKDSNLTCECVNRTLNIIFDIFKQEMIEHRDITIPSFLHCQFDNASDNKSKWVFAYCSDLVKRRIFLNLTIAFLYRGHTHTNIDQTFSVVAKLLRSWRCVTIAAFLECLRQVLPTLGTQVIYIKQLHDLKSYYHDHLFEHISGQTIPHQIRMWSTDDGCLVQFRKWFNTVFYPCCKLTVEEQLPSESIMEVIRRIDADASLFGEDDDDEFEISLLDAISFVVPAASRVASESKVNSFTFMKSYPEVNSIPRLVYLTNVEKFDETLKSLRAFVSHPNISMFTEDELTTLIGTTRQRIAEIEATRNEGGTWNWVQATHDAEEVSNANPHQGKGDKWLSLQVKAFRALPKECRETLEFFVVEMIDMQPGDMVAKPVKKRNPDVKKGAAKRASKKKGVGGKPKGKRKLVLSDDDEDQEEEEQDDSTSESEEDISGSSDDGSDSSFSGADVPAVAEPKSRPTRGKVAASRKAGDSI